MIALLEITIKLMVIITRYKKTMAIINGKRQHCKSHGHNMGMLYLCGTLRNNMILPFKKS